MELKVSTKDIPELDQIELSKADQIAKTFAPMVEMLKDFEGKYNELIEISEEGINLEVTAKAKRLRLDIAKVRIATDKTRKEQKKEYLLAGRAIDGVANILKWATSEKEEKLSSIENHYELMEQERLEKLQTEREALIYDYIEEDQIKDFSTMEEDVWEAYISAKKQAHFDRIEAEEKAEKERIKREEEETAERARIEAENAKLRKEAEEREKVFAKERADREKTQRAEQAKRDAEIKAERDARATAEAELKDRREKELKDQAEREAKIQAELTKGDADKIEDLIADLESIKDKYSFKSVKNKAKMDDVRVLIGKIVSHIRK